MMLLGMTEKTEILEHHWLEYLTYAKGHNQRIDDSDLAGEDYESAVLHYDETYFWIWYVDNKLNGGKDANATTAA
jgi:hypothetical protein